MAEFVSVFLAHCWDIINELSPWLIFGFLLAGGLKWLVPDAFVYRHLGGTGPLAVFKAVILGVPLPLCSCGVIPAAMGLYRQGASRSATLAFLISTPQTGVDSIMVSAGFFGWPFALFKVLVASVTGVVGGMCGYLFEKREVREQRSEGSEAAVVQRPAFRDIVTFVWSELFMGVWFWLMVGVLVSALISTLLPANAFKHTVLGSEWVGMLVMLLISLPLYICAVGSVPLAAALVHAGLPPGAALVMLLAGPASNFATMGAIYKVLGRRMLVIYLSVLVVGSLVGGALFNRMAKDLFPAGGVLSISHTLPHWLHGASAVVFCLALGFALLTALRRRFRRTAPPACCRHEAPEQAGHSISLKVEGIRCSGCARKIEQNLRQLAHVRAVAVDVSSGVVKVSSEDGVELDVESIRKVLRELGYTPV
ncbi:MAG: hypothetical protein D6820_16105 [Lentisphaerae bacterium]|nr:MAG: hypothetical protein D6820_16105 [Lentisphaerota bacterium]